MTSPSFGSTSSDTQAVSVASVQVFNQLAKILFGSSDDLSLVRVLQRVAEAARQLIPDLEEVSVTLIEGDTPRTAACTGRLASYLDERQYDLGFGPCLDAALAGETVVVQTADPATSAYREFARTAAARGVTHSLSIGLPIPQRTVGALNMYSVVGHAFSTESLALAESFAGYAGVAVANAALYQSAVQEARHMHQALETRSIIEQAKGILIGARGCSAAHAFGLLTRASQHQNRKLRDIAAELVEHAQAPPTAPAADRIQPIQLR